MSSPHLQVFENGSLNILDARDTDSGYYMCQASNGVGPGLSKVIRVTINGKLNYCYFNYYYSPRLLSSYRFSFRPLGSGKQAQYHFQRRANTSSS